MISEVVKTENNYETAFRALQSQRLAPGATWVERLRETAMDRFVQMGFPSVAEEEWKYTNVAPIGRIDFRPATSNGSVLFDVGQLEQFSYVEAKESRLVFVNGVPRPDLSSLSGLPDGFVAIDLAAALQSEHYGLVAQEYLARVVECGENGFTALNTALISHGAFVLIPNIQRLSLH